MGVSAQASHVLGASVLAEWFGPARMGCAESVTGNLVAKKAGKRSWEVTWKPPNEDLARVTTIVASRFLKPLAQLDLELGQPDLALSHPPRHNPPSGGNPSQTLPSSEARSGAATGHSQGRSPKCIAVVSDDESGDDDVDDERWDDEEGEGDGRPVEGGEHLLEPHVVRWEYKPHGVHTCTSRLHDRHPQ